MGTKTLSNIHSDLKLLITAISGFEDGEEGFDICERYCLSQLKHHRFLSINSHEVKKEIKELTDKFLIHGKYEVAKEFEALVESFINNFDFERHPQYDLQWSLLSLLLKLSGETCKADINTSKQGLADKSSNVSTEEENAEEIDWARYLSEGKNEFFCRYKSSSESEWSEDDQDGQLDDATSTPKIISSKEVCLIKKPSEDPVDKLSECLAHERLSKKWLKSNVQHTWWNELDWHQHLVCSNSTAANFCEHWRKNIVQSLQIVGTLSEYQACRELLWMFHGQASMLLFQETNSEFDLRQNASIPSLSTVAFTSMLDPYCKYLSMLRELELFVDRLFPRHGDLSHKKQPPFTYETYGIEIQWHIQNIKKELLEIEKKVMMQDSRTTFLSLSRKLKCLMDKVSTLYNVHRAVTDDWETSMNWKCSSTLLSKLYFKMQNSSSFETTNICASLYLSSLTVYLNIVDVWLTEGRLEDWRDEFVISKCKEASADDVQQTEIFNVRELDPICSTDPVMKLLLHKVCQMGRSVELLVNLDRISDLWGVMDKEKESSLSLKDKCMQEISAECSKYVNSSSNDNLDGSLLEIMEIPVPRIYNLDVEQNIVQQITSRNNPFLMRAFSTFLPSEDSIDAKTPNDWTSGISETNTFRFESSSKTVLPWRKILECTLSKILKSKYSGASKLVKDILVQEYKLEAHLKLMRSVYMMETNHVMNKFCKLLFKEIESNAIWNNSYSVSCILEEILSHEWPDSSSRWSVTVSDHRTRKVLEAVNGITLHYAAGWPINLLLTENCLGKYNRVFRFELKLKWSLWVLNNLKFADLEGSTSDAKMDAIEHFHIRRLETLRFWLLHAIGSIHSYLSGQVHQSLGYALDKALAQADNLEAIVTIHNEYLDNVHEHCLQSGKFDDVTRTIHKLLEMCNKIRHRWNLGSMSFAGEELDAMENDYVKFHTYLALALHNAVQHNDADYHSLMFTAPTVMQTNFPSMDSMSHFGKNILAEIAHQSLPPSGVPVLQRRVSPSISFCSDLSLTVLNEYEEYFRYLRWYYNQEMTSFNTSELMVRALYDVVEESRLWESSTLAET